MKSYLVTGAGGFIGAALAKELINRGAVISTIDDFSTGSKSNVPEGTKVLVGGCHDPNVISRLNQEKFDAIIHLAGQSSGEISFEDPINDLEKNVESTLRLLNYAVGSGCTRFIYGSSASVYGDWSGLSNTESSETIPLSCYGVGKLASENYLRIFDSRGVRTTSLRFSNVYGPGQNLGNMRQGMVSIYLAQLIDDSEEIVVKGSIDRLRDFVFVDDVVRGIIQTIDNAKSYGQVYNIGSGATRSVGELLEILVSSMGLEKEIIIEPSTPGDQKYVNVSIEKAKHDLAYEPYIQLEEGIARTVDWVKENNNRRNRENRPRCCRLCQADQKFQTIRSGYVSGGRQGQKFWECQECEVIYLFPPHSVEEEKNFYSHEFENFMGQRSGSVSEWKDPDRHRELNREEKDRRFEFVSDYLNGVDSCLEIGCSSGFMLLALRERGIDVVGVEPSSHFFNYLNKLDIETYQDWERYLDENHKAVDLIIHYFVLEHIRNPVEFLTQCMDRLNPGGKIVFEVPCASDPLIGLYSVPAFDLFYWSVAHHWYFNKVSLSLLLSKVTENYRLFPAQRYDLSNHMVWMAEGKPGGKDKYSSEFGSELNDLYKERMRATWQCDTLIAVLHKV